MKVFSKNNKRDRTPKTPKQRYLRCASLSHFPKTSKQRTDKSALALSHYQDPPNSDTFGALRYRTFPKLPNSELTSQRLRYHTTKIPQTAIAMSHFAITFVFVYDFVPSNNLLDLSFGCSVTTL